ncbi:MAG: hypothetical protein A3F54_04185 [Candidatus Kerfeldbacteria bacterium RIFCSPHIGHO2_12_FULL_48_17]|uniref:Phosphoglycerate mutase n=1 Tax=Candidatus Kerfeldbacteria bacterium RIFCSPHIGHO2_12_FULL_48_17 TaxID=1798542 RepID=A0A1G2B899_9BACT|nr:MAG: hypothetical protein A3F54_04185 [Candidatus Kerfeldbacteria bacterium RIFCSPHIGHO2_12_FULL_48_17]
MKKTLYFIRHGESRDEAEGWFSGHSDHPLTEQGQKQMHHIGFRFHVTPLDAIYVSPLERAHEAARIIGRYVLANIIVEGGLTDWNREGLLTGLTPEQAQRHYPEEVRKLAYYRSHALQGEKYEDFVRRVHQTFEKILASDEDRIMIVAHGRVIGTWLKEIHAISDDPQQIDHPAHALEMRVNRKLQPEILNSYVIQGV